MRCPSRRRVDRARRRFVAEAVRQRRLEQFAQDMTREAGPDAAGRGRRAAGASNWSFLLVPVVVALVALHWMDDMLAVAGLLAPVLGLGLFLWERRRRSGR